MKALTGFYSVLPSTPRMRAEELDMSEADYALLESLADEILQDPNSFSALHVHLDEDAKKLVVSMPEQELMPFPAKRMASENMASLAQHIDCLDRVLFGRTVS